MSTRGAIAKGTVGKWVGVYNHFDSYPSGLGVALTLAKDNRYDGDLDKMIKAAIDNEPIGWSSFPTEAYSSREAVTSTEPEITSESVNRLFIEWVYLLTPEGIWVGHPVDDYETQLYGSLDNDKWFLVEWGNTAKMEEVDKIYYPDEEDE